MCLVALAWKTHPRWRLLLAGNRDEFHERPTAPLAQWAAPAERVLAGRDLRSGGSWVGLGLDGRAAVVTNVRDPLATASGRSRGHLIADYLSGSADAATYARELAAAGQEFPPFNLLLCDAERCEHLSNHPALARALSPGIHGMSNGPLDTHWPKTTALTQALAAWCDSGSDDLQPLWTALANPATAADADLPHTGVDRATERLLSAAFIRGASYGTRASTIVAVDHHGHGFIHERRFGPDGVFQGETRLDVAGMH
ncbi:NRDE family protein [Xanthomonas campestris pv. campestris]|uniref:NRDE family protein n=1 Tax=Xanthomonas campestris TaxID=339 RepID=UPI002AD383DE|nr:NRDE family protein [Xanthomonas campestris]MEA0736687.1 NRDE family protein [Xanthomonas campestris pv. campestris]